MAWWQRRAAGAREVVAAAYQNNMGRVAETRLAAALQHVLAQPGSLVRAVAAYLLGVELGMAEELASGLACGIEYLHTASLIFDDLPAMDNARLRRGVACVHVMFGEGVATLAALALINRGYALLWRAMQHAPLARRSAAAASVDELLGCDGLIGGQAYDLAGWHGQQDPGEVAAVAARKTGALLRLTLVVPALCGRATSREVHLLDRLALLRGMAYQASDDLKDVLGDESTSGKSAGRDSALGRPNMVAAEGVAAALARFNRLQQIGDRVEAALPGGPDRWGMLRLLRVAAPQAGSELSLVSAAI